MKILYTFYVVILCANYTFSQSSLLTCNVTNIFGGGIKSREFIVDTNLWDLDSNISDNKRYHFTKKNELFTSFTVFFSPKENSVYDRKLFRKRYKKDKSIYIQSLIAKYSIFLNDTKILILRHHLK